MAVEPVSSAKRKTIIERAGGICEYCRSRASYSPSPFVIDHIKPKAKGGRTRIDNLALACSGCNGHKHARVDGTDPLTGRAARLFNPRRHRWQDHFTWNDDYSLIIGMTATGRASVELLRLNREELVNLRKALRLLNQHPHQGF